MATMDVVPHEAGGQLGRKRIVNDMSIQVATVNGSGSQSSNTVLLRSIFQMGVPVSGKNMFPSNIAGLPTWYTIRANKNGYIGRKKEIDFLVAMNPETAQEDTMSLAPGASVLYDEACAAPKVRRRERKLPAPATSCLPERFQDSSRPENRFLSCGRCSRSCWRESCTTWADPRCSTGT